MRIQRLDLFAFGTFSNARLDFSHKPDALQLIYGPNEAGKSTTLRALLALLYGIPARTSDAHIHDMTRLRIGATFRDERGQQLSVVRRKGLKQTLLDAEGQPTDESALAEMLGGLSEPLFRNMFGLDHERLREGAEALLKGGGHLGEGLFDASVGSRALRDLKESLSLEADELYKPRGKSPKLNQALELLKEKSREKKESALSPSAFVEQQRALNEKREQYAQATKLRRTLTSERDRISRVLQLLPQLARHDLLLSQLREHSHVRDHGGPSLLGGDLLEDQIRDLERRYGGALSAEADLPKLRTELVSLQRERELLRARVGVENIPNRPIDTPLRQRLRDLSNALQRADGRLRTLRSEVARLMRESEPLSERARTLRPTGSVDTLVALLSAVESESLLLNLTRAHTDITKRAVAIDRGLGQLGVQLGVEQLSSVALPEDGVLSAIEHELERTTQAQRLSRQREQEVASKLRDGTQRKALLLARGTPVTALALSEARDQRDVTLRELETQLSATDTASASSALKSLRGQVVHADQLADRMRAEVREASELSRIDSELTSLQDEAQQLLAARQEALDTLEALHQRARAALLATGLSYGKEPRDVRAKLLKLSALRDHASDLLAERAAYDKLRQRAQQVSRQLADALRERGETCPDDLDLAQRVAFARGHVARFQEHIRDADELERKAHGARAQAAVLGGEAIDCQAEIARCDERFRAQLRELGLPESLAAEELFACLDDVAAALVIDGKIAATEQRERQLQTISEKLRVDVAELVSTVLPGLGKEPLAAQLEALVREQRAQREHGRDRSRVQAELHKLTEELLHLGDGASIDALKVEAQQHDPSSLRARLDEIARSLEGADEELSKLDQQVGSIEAGMSHIAAAPHAVAAAEDVEAELGNVHGVLRRYLEVRLSQAILAREVERYRQQHQGPLLSRTSELFVRLTLKSYEGLSVEFDEQDEPVLCAVHKTQRRVRVAGLSDGTRDQLYLALRIASLERFLTGNRVLPLVLDDAFIHFDDARAEAALSMLGELSRRTQVLFFTHHLRMIDLAKRALKPAHVAIHELDPIRGTVNYRDDGPLFARI